MYAHYMFTGHTLLAKEGRITIIKIIIIAVGQYYMINYNHDDQHTVMNSIGHLIILILIVIIFTIIVTIIIINIIIHASLHQLKVKSQCG